MRTTIRVDDQLLADAKRLAAERGRTLTSVIEDALREAVSRQRCSRPGTRIALPVSQSRGRLQPGVDLDDTAALAALMESHDAPA